MERLLNLPEVNLGNFEQVSKVFNLKDTNTGRRDWDNWLKDSKEDRRVKAIQHGISGLGDPDRPDYENYGDGDWDDFGSMHELFGDSD